MKILRRSFGFTLIELLSVLAILAMLCALLFPVFSSAKNSARKAVCMSNMRQVGIATMIYAGDYDDYYVPLNHQPAEMPNSRNDRTWVQLLLPYVRNFSVFECPSDTSERPKLEATFDQDLIPGDLYSAYYSASLRSNLGYNFQYLSPVIRVGSKWVAQPKALSNVPEPSRTLLYADSVWSTQGGRPSGGGSWLISPPCRYEIVNGVSVDTFLNRGRPTESPIADDVFTPVTGWNAQADDSDNRFGGLWPWHSNRLNIVHAEGSVKNVSIAELSDGCDVQPNWQGAIFGPNRYPWYPR